MRADRGRPGEPARPPDPDRHPATASARSSRPPASRRRTLASLRRPPAGRRGQPCSPAPGSSASSPTARACTRTATTGRWPPTSPPSAPAPAWSPPSRAPPCRRTATLTRSPARCAPNWPRCTASTPDQILVGNGSADARRPDHHDPAHGALGALGAGAFGGRQRGDGLQLRLVLERGNPPSPTANHASCVGVSQPTTSALTPPVTRFRLRPDSEPSPSQ